MAVQRFEKDNYDSIDFSTDGWSEAERGADGSRTYTSTSDTASVTVKFRPPRADQTHDPCKIGSTVRRNADGSIEIKQIR